MTRIAQHSTGQTVEVPGNWAYAVLFIGRDGNVYLNSRHKSERSALAELRFMQTCSADTYRQLELVELNPAT